MVLDMGGLIRLKGYTCHVTCTCSAVLGRGERSEPPMCNQHRPRVEVM